MPDVAQLNRTIPRAVVSGGAGAAGGDGAAPGARRARLESVIAGLQVPSKRFLAYWLSLADGRALPMKSRFDPLPIYRKMANLMILEREPAGVLRVRLMGTAIVGRLSGEGTGRDVMEFVRPESRAAVGEAFETILEEPCGGHFKVVDSHDGGPGPTLDLIALPLADDRGRPRYIVTHSQVTLQGPTASTDEARSVLARCEGVTLFRW